MAKSAAPAKFRKKPRVVTAYRVTRQMIEEFLFNDADYPKGLRLGGASWNEKDHTISHWKGSVTTIHGQDTLVVEGDWVIDEGDGEHFYPCKPDVFAETYETADKPAAHQALYEALSADNQLMLQMASVIVDKRIADYIPGGMIERVEDFLRKGKAQKALALADAAQGEK